MVRRLIEILPLVILIFPQGTLARTLVPETVVASVLFLTAVLAVLQGLLRRQSAASQAPALDPLYLCLLTYLWVVNPLYSYYASNRPSAIVYVVLPFLLLGVYYLCSLGDIDERSIIRFTRNQVLAGCVLALVIILFGTSPDATGEIRATSFGNRERTLVLPILPMAAVIAFSQAIFLTARSQVRRRAFYAGCFLLCTAGIVLTVTRAMLLAELAGCSLVVVSSLSRRQRLVAQRWRILFLVAAVALAAGAILYQSAAIWEARLDPSVAGNTGTVFGRIDEINAFLSGFRESPLVGQGLGYRFSDPSSFDYSLAFGIFVPHNHFAFVAGTMGIVGLVLYYGVLLRTWGRLRAVARTPQLDPEYARTLIALTATLATGFMFTLTSTSFTTLSYNLLISVIAYASRLPWRNAERFVRAPSRAAFPVRAA